MDTLRAELQTLLQQVSVLRRDKLTLESSNRTMHESYSARIEWLSSALEQAQRSHVNGSNSASPGVNRSRSSSVAAAASPDTQEEQNGPGFFSRMKSKLLPSDTPPALPARRTMKFSIGANID
eukprot:TRINITY_DN33562_c0_g1_i1.p1 TRINITY_DN33562_c0_g1~~TRINITY_DN33562_c0_g1_i1.p1  ORF type:complete len:123 (+),score=24.72 TRINITY_DN33562_c0_g1_i1:239-607(+)